MSHSAHDPVQATGELGSKLSARTRHVAVLLGAGASKAAGLPDLQGLQAKVLADLKGDDKGRADKLFAKGNVETALSYLRRVSAILDAGQDLDGLTATGADDLQAKIATAIIDVLSVAAPNPQPFVSFGHWLAGADYRLPVEVFTINYDLLIEGGLEAASVPYFDGFVGSVHGRFKPDLVEQIEPGQEGALPSAFVRLWKLHGSINWQEVSEGDVRRIERLGAPAEKGKVAAIYPSDEKYDQSRRVPFVVLMDRLRRSLGIPETFTIVAGYSFGDQHLNEMLFDAARQHPRSEICALCFGSIPGELSQIARNVRNLTVLGRKEAVIGGHLLPWKYDDEAAGVWEGGEFLLGDFTRLASFLATAGGRSDHVE